MDNRYFNHGCPALMQDARFITNYTRGRVFDQFIRSTNNIESVHDYRTFLQSNADTIMTREREYAEKQNTCSLNGECAELGNKNTFDCACECRY